MKRRKVLTLATVPLAGLLTGCLQSLSGLSSGDSSDDEKSSNDGGARGAADVQVHSLLDGASSVSITITDLESGETELDESFQLEVGATEEFENPILYGGAYEISVAVEDGPRRTVEWRDVDYALHVLVENDDVTLAEELVP